MNKIIIIGILCFVALMAGYSCSAISDNQGTVIQTTDVAITQQDRVILPDVQKKVLYVPSRPKLGHRIEASILRGITKTVVVENNILDYGYANRLGVFGLAGIGGLDAGLSYRTFYVWRVGLDLLAGTIGAGAGVSYQITQNSSIGGSLNYSYNTLLSSPAVYLTVGL